jgi:hypothetical protein
MQALEDTMIEDEEKNEAKAKGGHARAETLPPERRKAIASRAALARWRGDGTRPIKASYAGTLKIGDMELDCANLPDGRRVISESTLMRALGRGYSGYYSQRDAAGDPSAVLPRYVAPVSLRPFITDELMSLLSKPVPYLPPPNKDGGRGGPAKGVEAETLPMICDVWLKARAEGVLTDVQLRTAAKAEVLIRGLATVGIVALVDEATGYQQTRDREALQAILDLFLRKELAVWAKRFPDAFYEQIFRLRGWKWRGMHVNRPQVVAHYTKDLVYARLAPGILKELETRTPREARRSKKARFHMWLTDDIGHPALAQHVHAVMGLMRAARSWDQFMSMINAAFPKMGDTLQLFPTTDPSEPSQPS